MTATQAFRNALHVPTADPAAGRTVTVLTPGDEYEATWQIAGGIPEAPPDGQLYGREGLAEVWEPILPQPAADILEALKTVDGPGSGLDADTVDGYHAAYLIDWYSLTNAPSTFPPQLPIPMSGVTDLESSLLAKADLAYVDAKDALKANITYVDAADALKADTTYVDGQDAALDVRLDAVETDKANIDYVDAADAAIQADLDSKVEEAPIDGLQYARSDAGWVEVVATGGGGGGAATSIGDDPPADPVVGQLWWDSDSGRLYIFYDDGDTQQWVEVVPPVGASKDYVDGNFLPLSGGTLSGDLTVNDNIVAATNITAGYNLFTANNVRSTGPYIVVSADNALGTGVVYLRPNAYNSSVGQVTIDTDGLVTVRGPIKFQAAQVASTDANALDDYEEGTWTPTLQFGGAAVGMTYSARTGTYTKIGRQVFAQFDFTLSAKGTSVGNAELNGPFTAIGTGGTGMLGYWAGMASVTSGYITIYVAGSGHFIRTGGATGITGLTEANFTNTSRLIGCIVYQTST